MAHRCAPFAGSRAGASRRIPGMTIKDSSPRGLKALWMAWNRPGGSTGNGGSGIGRILNSLPSLGGGSPLRWVGLVFALWLAFNCFVLIAEQQRGVVLRFGQFDRVMQPGPNFKLPWPVETVTKVNATQIKNYEASVPVLTRDENIVDVSINVQYKVADPQAAICSAHAMAMKCSSRRRSALCVNKWGVPIWTPCWVRVSNWPCLPASACKNRWRLTARACK